MQDFVAFLRLTALGLIILLTMGLLVARSILDLVVNYGASGPVFFALMATLVGLLVEPLLRHHPLSSEVRAIYDHVKAIMISGLTATHECDVSNPITRDARSGSEQRIITPEFWTVVSKSVYDYLIFTFPGTETYMRRVNQQIRIAYFYILIWYVYRGSIFIGMLALAIKAFVKSRRNPIALYLGHYIDLQQVNKEVLMGYGNILDLSVILFLCFFLLLFPARFFFRIGLETMALELYSRHIVLIQNRSKIVEITHQLMNDQAAIAVFERRAAAVRALIARKPMTLGYWIFPQEVSTIKAVTPSAAASERVVSPGA